MKRPPVVPLGKGDNPPKGRPPHLRGTTGGELADSCTAARHGTKSDITARLLSSQSPPRPWGGRVGKEDQLGECPSLREWSPRSFGPLICVFAFSVLSFEFR